MYVYTHIYIYIFRCHFFFSVQYAEGRFCVKRASYLGDSVESGHERDRNLAVSFHVSVTGYRANSDRE